MQFQKIRRMMKSTLHCHPERGEGSVALGSEMLRCAQHDSAVTPTDGQIVLLKAISGSPDNEVHYEYKDK
jgi:hypothetical protein